VRSTICPNNYLQLEVVLWALGGSAFANHRDEYTYPVNIVDMFATESSRFTLTPYVVSPGSIRFRNVGSDELFQVVTRGAKRSISLLERKLERQTKNFERRA